MKIKDLKKKLININVAHNQTYQVLKLSKPFPNYSTEGIRKNTMFVILFKAKDHYSFLFIECINN